MDNMVKNGKLSRAGKTVTCKICKQLGHNQRTCKLKDKAPNTQASTSAEKKKAGTKQPTKKKGTKAPTPSTPLSGKSQKASYATASPRSQGIIIRDSPSRNTRSSQASKLSQEATKGKGKAVE